MRSGRRKLVASVSLVGAGGFLFSGPGTGCNSYLGESLLVATDFCFVFDCQNGIFAGTVDPCATGPVFGPGGEPLDEVRGPLFVDCGNLVEP